MNQARVPGGTRAGGQFAATTRAEADVTLYFHVAPEDARSSIESHGIDHTRGESAYADTRLDYPAGNYLFGDGQAAVEYAEIRADEERDEYGLDARGYDIYEVHHDGPVEVDPFADDESGLGVSAVYTTAPIPPDRVRPWH